jgi:hypothetical protein
MSGRAEAQLQTAYAGEEASNSEDLTTWCYHMGMVAQTTPKTLPTLCGSGSRLVVALRIPALAR